MGDGILMGTMPKGGGEGMSIVYGTKVGACKHCSKPLDPTNFFTNHGLVINGRNAHEFCDDGCDWKRGVEGTA